MDFNRSDMDNFFGESTEMKNIDYEAELNAEQYEACTTTEGPLLIIAGAGSGKTRVLTYRLSYLIEKGLAMPQQILLMTFTNKAAREMKQRARQMLDSRCDKVVSGTYHSFCSAILKRYLEYTDFKKDFIIKDSVDAVDMINLIKEKIGISKEEDFPDGRTLSTIYSMCINRNKKIPWILENKYPKFIEQEEKIMEVWKGYIAYKKERNILDYDDLLIYTVQLLRKHPDISRAISDTYKYIMVDEYQDSNSLQFQLIYLLRQFDNNNICVVGDDQQCIYGFRGSNHNNILDFPKYFKGCKMVILDKNYRSNQEILDLSNAVAMGAIERFEKNLVGTHSGGKKPSLIQTDNEYEMARAVIYDIVRKMREGIPLSEIAVLVRSSNDSSFLEAMIMKDASRHAITYKKFGGIKFMEKSFVKDIFAYLRVIVNVKDEVSWFRILQLYPGIGPTYAKRISEAICNEGIEYLNSPKHAKKKFAEYFPDIYAFYTITQHKDFSVQIDDIINVYYRKAREESISVARVIKGSRREMIKEMEEEIENAQVLIEIAKPFNIASEFLNNMTLEQTEDEEEDKEYLTVSTVHSAKGLEFNTVYILNCVEGKFPWVKKPLAETEDAILEMEEEMEEERRVFYVAVTRAKENLYMMVPSYIMMHGKSEQSELSRFISTHYCDMVRL